MGLSKFVIKVVISCGCLFSEVLYPKQDGKMENKGSFKCPFHHTEFLGLTLEMNITYFYIVVLRKNYINLNVDVYSV